MHLIHTEENFTNMDTRDKMNLVKELSHTPADTSGELSITVLTDGNGNFYLEPGREKIPLEELQTVEAYLQSKYPLSNVVINRVRIDA